MSTKRRYYSAEFKAEAVELAEKIGDSKASIELGICQSNIRRWRRPDQIKRPISNHGKTVTELEKENRKLHKELEYLRRINEVLKKSTAIFSSYQMQSSR